MTASDRNRIRALLITVGIVSFHVGILLLSRGLANPEATEWWAYAGFLIGMAWAVPAVPAWVTWERNPRDLEQLTKELVEEAKRRGYSGVTVELHGEPTP